MSQSGEDTSLLMMLIISYLSQPKKQRQREKKNAEFYLFIEIGCEGFCLIE